MGIIENFFTNFDKDKTHEIASYYKVELNEVEDLQNFDLNRIESLLEK